MALDAERLKYLASIPRDPKTGQIDFPAAKAKGYTDRDMIEADLEKRRMDAEQAPNERVRAEVIKEALQMKADFKAGKGPYVGQGYVKSEAPKGTPGVELPVEGAQVLRSEPGRPDIGSPHGTHDYYLKKLSGVTDPMQAAAIAEAAIGERLAGVNRDSQITAAPAIVDEWLDLLGHPSGKSVKELRATGRELSPAQKELEKRMKGGMVGPEIDRGKALEATKAKAITGYKEVSPTRTDIVPMATEAVAGEIKGVYPGAAEKPADFTEAAAAKLFPPPAISIPPSDGGAVGGAKAAPPTQATTPLATVSAMQADKTNKGAGPGMEYGQPAQGLKPQPRANAPIVQQSIQGNGTEPPPVTGEAPAAKDMRGISGSDLLNLLGQLGLGVTDIAQAHYAGKAGITDPSKLAYRMRAEDEAARQAQEAERAFQEKLLGTQAGYAKEAQERELAGKKDVATFEAEIQAARDERIMAMEERVAERASKMEADLKRALQDDDQAFELTKLMALQDYERESAMEAQERQKELMAIGLSNDIALAQAQAEHERRLAELRAALEGNGKKVGLTAGGLPDLAAAYGIPSVKPLTASK